MSGATTGRSGGRSGVALGVALGVLLLAVLVGAPAAAAPAAVCRVQDGGLQEISGLAAVPGGYLVAEDSGAGRAYVLLDAACATVGSVRVQGFEAEDVEDLAVTGGTVWLADIGDNQGARDDLSLIAVPVPVDRGEVTQRDARTVRLRYPDGARDAEALLVLPDGRVALVTKTYGGVAGVYATPGPPPASVTLERVTEVELPQATRSAGPIGSFGSSAVTGGAVSPDGRLVALRTYADVLVWRLLPDLAATFAAEPVVLTPPEEPQGEAVAFTPDSRSVLVVSEGSNPPLYAQPLPVSLAGPAEPAATGAGESPGRASPAVPGPGSDGETGGPAAAPPTAPAAGAPGSRAGVLAVLGGGLLVLVLAAAAALAGRWR